MTITNTGTAITRNSDNEENDDTTTLRTTYEMLRIETDIYSIKDLESATPESASFKTSTSKLSLLEPTPMRKPPVLTPIAEQTPQVINTIAEILARVGEELPTEIETKPLKKYKGHEAMKSKHLMLPSNAAEKKLTSKSSRSVLDLIYEHNMTTILYYIV